MDPRLKKLKNDCIYAAILCLVRVHRLMPRELGLLIFEIIGAAAFWLPNKQRTLTIHHLRTVFGLFCRSENRKTIKITLLSWGRLLYH